MDTETQAKIDSLNSQICQKRNRVYSLSDSIAALRRKLEDGHEVLRRYHVAADQFHADSEYNLQSVNHLAAFENMKLAKKYSESLASTLNGPKKSSALSALDHTNSGINNEISRLEQEIAAKQREIYSLENQIASLQSQIYSLK